MHILRQIAPLGHPVLRSISAPVDFPASAAVLALVETEFTDFVARVFQHEKDMEILILASVKRATGRSKLPDYARMMSAYHRAFARELKELVSSLPIRPGDRVVDFACGDGSYSRWLARQVGREGTVVALDISPAFLELARRKSRASSPSKRIQFVQGDLRHLPLATDGFDLVWCAQSLYSLPDPVEALRQMSRSVRAGGHVSVVENDEFHHVLLPWPVELELALKKAELMSFMEQSDRPRKFYVGRDLRRAFRTAGLVRCQARSIAFSRGAPLDRASRAFFAGYLDDLRRRVSPHLEPVIRGRFERLVVPGSDRYLLSSPDLTITCVNQVMTGVRPQQPSKRGQQRAR